MRTLPSPAAGATRAQLRGARLPNRPLPDPADYLVVQRTVSKQGAIQLAGSACRSATSTPRATVTIHVHDHHVDIFDDHGTPLRTIARTNTKQVTRLKAWTRKP